MAKTFVLDRVAADLARGYTHPAIQRLSSLVAAYPNDLDLRRRLAAVHRRVGNRIQAGRWDYLTVGADADDTRAFERAFPSAVARLRQVRWPYRAGEAATSYARQRLAALIAAAQAEHPVQRTRAALRARADRVGLRAGRDRVGLRAGRDRAAGTGSVAALPAGSAFAGLWHRLRHSRRWAVLTAAVTTGPLSVVGAVTVLEWIVQ